MKILFLQLVVIASTWPICVGQQVCQVDCAQGPNTLESVDDCIGQIANGMNQCDPFDLGLAKTGTCVPFGPCDNGGIVCGCSTKSTTAVVHGDPHFTSWKGRKFDFHGQCDLVMVHNPDFHNGLGLTIHIRTQIRKAWSYITAVAIQIGTDVLEVHGGSDENRYWINGDYQGDLSITTLGGFEVRYFKLRPVQRGFRIYLEDNQEIFVKTHKDFVRVEYERPTMADMATSVGILGNFVTGDLLGRDGVTVIDDMNELGMEWQVQESEPTLFQELVSPQHPEKCQMPLTVERRRLGEVALNEDQARDACSHVNGEDLMDCIYDVVMTGDIDMAQEYE